MQLEQLLSLMGDLEQVPACTVITCAAEPPIVWRTRFIQLIKARLSVPLSVVKVEEGELGSHKALFETTFLGQSQFYWIDGFDNLDKKKQTAALDYFLHYTGPHRLLVWGAPSSGNYSSLVSIDLRLSVDKAGFMNLASLFGRNSAMKNQRFIQAVFDRHDTLSLDIACLLTDYAELVGANTQQFCDSWLDGIVVPEKSLFSLSQSFFAKDSAQFFTQWAVVMNEYPPVFWLSYWSEQLWRAAWVVDLYKAGKALQAKKIGYRLPFTFLGRDWKKITSAELCAAHNFLYSLDVHLKNGGQIDALDLLYAKFFAGDFLPQ